MRRIVGLAVLVTVLVCAPAPASDAVRPWATVNMCDPADRPGAMGVRVGVPAGPGAQWIRVRAEWYDATARRWKPARGGDGGWERLGDGRRGVRGGTTFVFPVPEAGKLLLLRGVVRVQWRRGGRAVRAGRLGTRGGLAAQAGGTSWAQCIVPG